MNWECYSLFWEVFVYLLDRAGANIWPQIRPREIPDLVYIVMSSGINCANCALGVQLGHALRVWH